MSWFYINYLTLMILLASLPQSEVQVLQTNRIWLFLSVENLESTILKRRFYESAKKLTLRSLERRARSIASSPPIRLCDLAPSDDKIKAIEATGCRVVVMARYINAVSVVGLPEAIIQAQRLPFVIKSQPVLAYVIPKDNPDSDKEVPNINYLDDFNNQYKMYFKYKDTCNGEMYCDEPQDYGRTWWQCVMMNVPAVHSLNIRGQGILIGVHDTGFDNLNHRCFNNLNIVATWDFINDDPNVADEGDIGTGRHGTRTLSILAGYDPGRFIGVAPMAQYVLTKTEISTSEIRIEEDYWIAGLWFNDSIGTDVVSSSVSYREWYGYPDMDGRTALITRAADSAAAAGLVIINSMGNTGGSSYPFNKMGAPADGRMVIGVGGVERDSTYWTASSQGPTYDGRTKPDLSALSAGVAIASSLDDTSYLYGNGTSFACPLIAGVAALVLQANRDLTSNQVLEILRRVGHNALQPDTLIGWGIPNTLEAVRIAQNGVKKVSLMPFDTDFEVYPNPFNGFLYVNAVYPIEFTRLDIFDLKGRKIMPQMKIISSNIIQLDFNTYCAGSYWLSYNRKCIQRIEYIK